MAKPIGVKGYTPASELTDEQRRAMFARLREQLSRAPATLTAHPAVAISLRGSYAPSQIHRLNPPGTIDINDKTKLPSALRNLTRPETSEVAARRAASINIRIPHTVTVEPTEGGARLEWYFTARREAGPNQILRKTRESTNPANILASPAFQPSGTEFAAPSQPIAAVVKTATGEGGKAVEFVTKDQLAEILQTPAAYNTAKQRDPMTRLVVQQFIPPRRDGPPQDIRVWTWRAADGSIQSEKIRRAGKPGTYLSNIDVGGHAEPEDTTAGQAAADTAKALHEAIAPGMFLLGWDFMVCPAGRTCHSLDPEAPVLIEVNTQPGGFGPHDDPRAQHTANSALFRIATALRTQVERNRGNTAVLGVSDTRDIPTRTQYLVEGLAYYLDQAGQRVMVADGHRRRIINPAEIDPARKRSFASVGDGS